jgi:ABC-type lipoprotein release transport system permease subunit
MIKMINIILSIFSILLTISSFGVAFISIQASMKEASKEIGLFKTIGISKKSIFMTILPLQNIS